MGLGGCHGVDYAGRLRRRPAGRFLVDHLAAPPRAVDQQHLAEHTGLFVRNVQAKNILLVRPKSGVVVFFLFIYTLVRDAVVTLRRLLMAVCLSFLGFDTIVLPLAVFSILMLATFSQVTCSVEE